MLFLLVYVSELSALHSASLFFGALLALRVEASLKNAPEQYRSCSGPMGDRLQQCWGELHADIGIWDPEIADANAACMEDVLGGCRRPHST